MFGGLTTSNLVTFVFAFVSGAHILVEIIIGQKTIRKIVTKSLMATSGCAIVVFTKIFMDESKKHLYRLDPVKLQQKIYDLYPTNSVVRKRMISDIKKEQLSYYSRLLEDFPVQAAQTSLEQNQKTMVKFAISGLFFFTLGTTGILSGILFKLSLLESVLLALLGGLSLGFSFAQFKLLLTIKEASDNFTKAISGIKQKISDLSKDL